MADDFKPSSISWVFDATDLHRLLGALTTCREVVIDLETTGLDENAVTNGSSNGGVAARIVLASLTLPQADDSDPLCPTTWVLPLSHPDSPWRGSWRSVMRKVAQAILDNRRPIVNHNVKFDLRWITATTGVDLTTLLSWDTMLSSNLVDENTPAKLKVRAPRMFDVEAWDDVTLNYPGAAEDEELFDLGVYAARDTYWTWRLAEAHRRQMFVPSSRVPAPDRPEFDDEFEDAYLGRLAERAVMPMMTTLTQMEQRGLQLDHEWIENQINEHETGRAETFDMLVSLYPSMQSETAAGGKREPSFSPSSLYFREWAQAAVDQGDLRVTAMTASGRPQWSKAVLTRQARQGSEVADLLLSHRAHVKKLEFLRSWLAQAAPNGRIYATYNAGSVVTGRLSSSGPNMQQVTKSLKPAFIPSPGHYFAELDYSQIELRVAAYVARCEPMLEAYRREDDLHTLMAARISGKSPQDVTKAERQAGKACIARGQLVTTNKGLVPIEDVTTAHRVWDGVEWVEHEGVVFQGVRDVMTYQGLTATPDHLVFISDSIKVCLSYASNSNTRIVESSPAVPSGLPDGSRRDDDARQASSLHGDMHAVRSDLHQGCNEHQERSGSGLQVPAQSEVQRSSGLGARESLRRDEATMQAGSAHSEELRRPRNRDAVREPSGVHRMGSEDVAGRVVRGQGLRPNQQRRALRGGEPAPVHAQGKPAEPKIRQACAVHGADGCPRTRVASDSDGSSGLHLYEGDHGEQTHERGDTRVDSGARDHVHWSSGAEVYDIVNAGPRHRFTVSRKVVSNCNFGLLYGMGANGFREYADTAYGVQLTEEEALHVHKSFFEMWEGIGDWHRRAIHTARRDGQIVSPLGRIRRVPNINSDDLRTSSEAERHAVNSPVQGLASDLMQMSASSISGNLPVPGARGRRGERLPAVPGARIVGTVHDSILVEVPIESWEETSRACQVRMEIIDRYVAAAFGVKIDVPLVSDFTVMTRWGADDIKGED